MFLATDGRSSGRPRRRAGYIAASALALAGLASLALSAGGANAAEPADNSANTATPIKHVVVLFDENRSFDNYFGTYPNAQNLPGETVFTAASGTPVPNNYTSNPNLLTANPNTVQPSRLTPAQAVTCSMNHSYVPEQQAFDGGAMDKFVQFTQAASNCATAGNKEYNASVMDYYDGNTVTGEWNYAQNYALNDNSFNSTFGPSTPGALNLIAGTTYGATPVNAVTGAPDPGAASVASQDSNGLGTIPGDADPFYDDCSDNSARGAGGAGDLVTMQGSNIGDALNSKGVSWGWFQGGFAPSTPWDGNSADYASCQGNMHPNVQGVPAVDYSPHHNPFAYYQSTANPHHLAPADEAEIGHDGQANHNYDLTLFQTALDNDNVPAVSFLKAAQYQDGHGGYSDPTDEQHFLVNEINAIQSSSIWPDTAIVIAYDDSDGWYDHVASDILNGSNDPNVTNQTDPSKFQADQPMCTSGPAPTAGQEDRCGPGPRTPLLVISPYTTPNTLNSDPTEQASILKFIEDNWGTGQLGNGSFDARAGSMDGMFNFDTPQQRAVLLNQDGTVAQIVPVQVPAATPTPTPTPTPTSTTAAAAGGSSLAATGFQVTGFVIGGALLIAAGLTLWIVRRRKVA